MSRSALTLAGLVAGAALWRLGGAALQQTAPPAQTAPGPGQAPAAPAAEQPQPGGTVIRIQTDEVIVPVAVTSEGKFVTDLTQNDFRVSDEGTLQRITYFNHDPRQPVVFGFLVDLSSNSRIHWNNYKDAIKELIWDLIAPEKHTAGYLITYSNEAELAADTTSDGEALAEKVDKLKPGGAAAMYDAIEMACMRRKLLQGEPYEPRRVIVVIGDGHDDSSKISLEQTIELAKRNMTTIYGMSTVAYAQDNVAADTLEQIATETGGIVEYPMNNLYRDVSGYISVPTEAGNYVFEAGTGSYAGELTKGIVRAVTNIKGEVTTQYVIHYVPWVAASTVGLTYRRIKVEIPSLPNIRIHAREGYYPHLAQPPAPPPQ